MEKTTVKTKEEKVVKTEFNPLRNEKIYVRWIPKKAYGIPDDKQHVANGGKVDGATDTFVVPMLRSTGKYKNVLTNDEKDFFERELGLDYNALSVYNTENNFWDDYKIVIGKEGLTLDMSVPTDYIKWKVLLANSEDIAPSVQDRIDRPKNTYKYEIVRKSEEDDIENEAMDATMACYKEFGKIEEDKDTLRTLVELLDGRPYDIHNSPAFFKARVNKLIQQNPKTFLRQIKDPMLHIKMVIKRSVELGKLSVRGDWYYLKSDGSPLCEQGENPTLAIAAKYLSSPSHQDIKYLLESEVNDNRS